jgi:hypothetical protein
MSYIELLPDFVTWKEFYFFLFDSFSEIMVKENPCRWIGNTCILNRDRGGANGCCNACKMNTYAGCSIQNLGCKSFLCERAFNNLSIAGREKWRELIELNNRYIKVYANEKVKTIVGTRG